MSLKNIVSYTVAVVGIHDHSLNCQITMCNILGGFRETSVI